MREMRDERAGTMDSVATDDLHERCIRVTLFATRLEGWLLEIYILATFKVI